MLSKCTVTVLEKADYCIMLAIFSTVFFFFFFFFKVHNMRANPLLFLLQRDPVLFRSQQKVKTVITALKFTIFSIYHFNKYPRLFICLCPASWAVRIECIYQSRFELSEEVPIKGFILQKTWLYCTFSFSNNFMQSFPLFFISVWEKPSKHTLSDPQRLCLSESKSVPETSAR